MSNLVYSFDDINRQLSIIVQEIQVERYHPDVIMAPARGGLAIGVMLSHYFDCPFQDFTWQTRDGENDGINEDSKRLSSLLSKYNGKNILIIDDINDCLLYTSDAADDMQCVDLGGRRIIKKIFFFFKQKTAYEM